MLSEEAYGEIEARVADNSNRTTRESAGCFRNPHLGGAVMLKSVYFVVALSCVYAFFGTTFCAADLDPDYKELAVVGDNICIAMGNGDADKIIEFYHPAIVAKATDIFDGFQRFKSFEDFKNSIRPHFSPDADRNERK